MGLSGVDWSTSEVAQVTLDTRRRSGRGFRCKMPRQNRVTPLGTIIASPERGTFMGNRGVLHDAEGHVKRSWQVKRWIVCVLEFRGRKRTIMKANSYTELFFLDEATALAAGHRPCAECRHARFLDFCTAWRQAHRGNGGLQRPTADEIDNCLHSERITADRLKKFHTAALDELPDGVIVALGEQPYLVLGNRLLAWSPGGYRERRLRPKHEMVKVLTPPSTVAAIRAGYVPEVHASAK